ncbi:MAG TPA: hypothetical protein VKW08_14575 [Xanthobacteraceae bacterium]|nr:hypothetical protein [Xanthobacteraceae bacterium]
MLYRGAIGTCAPLCALICRLLGVAHLGVLGFGLSPAAAFDDAQYPAFNGKWNRLPFPGAPRTPQPTYDPRKGWAEAQQAPLTAEYTAIFKANEKDQAEGGAGTTRGYTCRTGGMPLIMTLFQPMEMVVLPDTTYVLIDRSNIQRRIFTDGRDWPKEIEPAYSGYSIGRWLDTQGSGHYDTLLVETRAFRGPRTYDASGLPLAFDEQSIIFERLSLDAANRNVMHNEITVIDHGLTRPWTVMKDYRRDPGNPPVFQEEVCAEGNPWVQIGDEAYMRSANDELMPAKKDQPPPDLRYFNRP